MPGKKVKVLYEGPCDKVNVVPFGEHVKGAEKEYPEDFARELIATSKTQIFKIDKSSGDAQAKAEKTKIETKVKAEAPPEPEKDKKEAKPKDEKNESKKEAPPEPEKGKK